MPRKLKLISLAVVTIVIVASVAWHGISDAIKRAKTWGALGKIFVVIGKTYKPENASYYDPFETVLNEFPDLPSKNGRIIDAWGTPIRVDLMDNNDGYHLNIISAGPDRALGTPDDIILTADPS